jgi:hypothetical protein|tara:strand:- start:172 stop:342 length:171 start_codon:yes stop_codon:yes gene_type:complete
MDDAGPTDPDAGGSGAVVRGLGCGIFFVATLYLVYRVINWLLQWLAGIEMDPSSML